MNSYHDARLDRYPSRVARFAAAFATSTTLLLAVGGAFYSVSSDPVLADSERARLAVAGCDALDDRAARQRCVQRLVVEARARDSGAVKPAVLAAK